MATATAIPARVFAYEIANGVRDLNDRIDEQAGVIKGVKLTGFRSKNVGETIGLSAEQFGEAARKPYRYSDRPNAAKLYEGRKVYIDHPAFEFLADGRRVAKNPDRSLRDSIGWIENVQYVAGDGYYGDLHYKTSHPFAAELVETVKRNPSQLALSQVAAWGNPRLENGEIVVDIEEVRSIDLVGDEPGTTKNLFEGMAMNDMEYATEAPVEAAPAAGIDEAIMALMADADDAAKVKILKGLISKIRPSEAPAAEADAEPEKKPDEEKKPPAAETRAAPKYSYEQAIDLLNSKGKRVSKERVSVLRHMPDDSTRLSYVEDLSDNVAHETARSSAQQPASKAPPAKEPSRVFKAGELSRSLRGE